MNSKILINKGLSKYLQNLKIEGKLLKLITNLLFNF